MDHLADLARGIVDSNVYLTIGTASEDGIPWATPVFFAVDGDYKSYYWVSSPLAKHSHNIAVRPTVSLVIFDSQAPVGQGQAVYASGRAAMLESGEVAPALRIYPGDPARGGRAFMPADVTGKAPYRLYRAVAQRFWVLDPDGSPDKRIEVKFR